LDATTTEQSEISKGGADFLEESKLEEPKPESQTFDEKTEEQLQEEAAPEQIEKPKKTKVEVKNEEDESEAIRRTTVTDFAPEGEDQFEKEEVVEKPKEIIYEDHCEPLTWVEDFAEGHEFKFDFGAGIDQANLAACHDTIEPSQRPSKPFSLEEFFPHLEDKSTPAPEAFTEEENQFFAKTDSVQVEVHAPVQTDTAVPKIKKVEEGLAPLAPHIRHETDHENPVKGWLEDCFEKVDRPFLSLEPSEILKILKKPMTGGELNNQD